MFLVDQLPSCFKVSPTKVTLSPGEALHIKVTSMLVAYWGSALISCKELGWGGGDKGVGIHSMP